MRRCGGVGVRAGRRGWLAWPAALILCATASWAGLTQIVDVSGTFGLDVLTVPIPATLVDEIQLDTPAELTLLKFGMEARLDVRFAYADTSLRVNTAMSIPGLQRFVADGQFYLGPLLVKPEMWFAVPFETVTDINHFPNWVVIPPGDMMFVKLRCTTEVGLGSLRISNLFMLEDVTFPSPLVNFVPLQYPVQSQSFHTGDILTITTELFPDVNLTSVTRFCATDAMNAIKGWSARGSVDADASLCDEFCLNGTLSLSGIRYCGLTLWFALDVNPCGDPVLALSGGGSLEGFWSIGLTGAFSLFPIDIAGFSFTTTLCDCFTATVQLSEHFAFEGATVRGQWAIDTGIMKGNLFAACSFVGTVGRSASLGVTLGHGTTSGSLSLAFSEQLGSLRLTGTNVRLVFANAPSSFTISVGFGRGGLAQAAFGVGLAF